MRPSTLGVVFVIGCLDSGSPPEGAVMCEHAESLYGACLTEWGLDWSAAGYTGAADFAAACETWSWEARLLERDAIRADRAEAGALAAACEVRGALYGDSETTCDDWVAEPWSALPWDD